MKQILETSAASGAESCSVVLTILGNHMLTCCATQLELSSFQGYKICHSLGSILTTSKYLYSRNDHAHRREEGDITTNAAAGIMNDDRVR
jgi:hypothetical protein